MFPYTYAGLVIISSILYIIVCPFFEQVKPGTVMGLGQAVIITVRVAAKLARERHRVPETAIFAFLRHSIPTEILSIISFRVNNLFG